MKTNFLIIIVGLIILSSFIFVAIWHSIPSPILEEHYSIEITGMKDIYRIGEQYDFSYIITGYGYSCGGKEITFPDQTGKLVTIISSSSCVADATMRDFVFDVQKESGTTYGHVGIKNPGTYNVTIVFDRPSQELPTTAVKEFLVAS